MTESQQLALHLAQGQDATPKNIERVAAKVGGEDARWAFTQWELRKRARAKFALADQMLFDRDGLEMATHERVAEYHASHFPKGETVADLCCGIGGDLVALAKRGPVIGYETDPVRAEYARHNLSVHGLEGEVCDHSADTSALACDSVFLDPQRRGKSGYGEPDPTLLKERANKSGLIVVKLGTSFDMEQVREDLFPCVEAVSFGGECRELLAKSCGGPGRYAYHVETSSRLKSREETSIVPEPGQYLLHADPALIKAGALSAFYDDERITLLGDSDGYLTSEQPTFSHWWKTYRVVYNGPADRKTTQANLAQLGARVVEVKTRGVSEPAERIRARFKAAGIRPLILAVWPVDKSLRHTLVEPVDKPGYGL
ncbi:MAG TPA: hypothetical protein VNI20_00580 [Fimbriimonadaceae bacterium]|nr:hypothetical protein [Fimbriimonadaceae bacterium]